MVDWVYSVKAGYRLLVDEELGQIAGPLSPPPSKSLWKGLWKLRIPNRSKKILWHAVSDALPTWVNLVKRKILTDATCQLCGLDEETILHALWSCPKLNRVLGVHFKWLMDEAKECVTFQEVFQMCLEKDHPLDMLAMLTSQI